MLENAKKILNIYHISTKLSITIRDSYHPYITGEKLNEKKQKKLKLKLQN
jgi:hypothetical protein